jgi:DDE superfamily endonuclease
LGCSASTPAPPAASTTPQAAVYLSYASDAGHAIVDRELYLPSAWTCDPARCRAAGVPDQVGFATKPALATRMLTRALDARVPAGWVAGTPQQAAHERPGPPSEIHPAEPARDPAQQLLNNSCHRAGSTSTLWPAATVWSSGASQHRMINAGRPRLPSA